MKSFLGGFAPIAFLIGVILIGMWLQVHVNDADQNYIEKWAIETHVQPVKVERCFWQNGPYYFRGKSQRIWRVELSDGRVAWFRTGMWTNSVEFE